MRVISTPRMLVRQPDNSRKNADYDETWRAGDDRSPQVKGGTGPLNRSTKAVLTRCTLRRRGAENLRWTKRSLSTSPASGARLERSLVGAVGIAGSDFNGGSVDA